MVTKRKNKSKIRLSDNLKLGVSAPASQSAFFKYGGAIFLVLSVILVLNIIITLHRNDSGSNKVLTSAQLQQQVLGAYDEQNNTPKISGYKVQPGDTVFVIAQTLHVDWQLLATLNNLKAPYAIKPGQILKVPSTSQNQN